MTRTSHHECGTEHCLSRCCPWLSTLSAPSTPKRVPCVSKVSFTWELVRTAGSWVPPQAGSEPVSPGDFITHINLEKLTYSTQCFTKLNLYQKPFPGGLVKMWIPGAPPVRLSSVDLVEGIAVPMLLISGPTCCSLALP